LGSVALATSEGNPHQGSVSRCFVIQVSKTATQIPASERTDSC
jgi:hypothetical protein